MYDDAPEVKKLIVNIKLPFINRNEYPKITFIKQFAPQNKITLYVQIFYVKLIKLN